MRDRIRKRLEEYRAEALDSIAIAANRTKATYAGHGTLTSSMCYLAVTKDNETGLAEYIWTDPSTLTTQAADTTLTLACEDTETSQWGSGPKSSEKINIGIIVDLQKGRPSLAPT